MDALPQSWVGGRGSSPALGKLAGMREKVPAAPGGAASGHSPSSAPCVPGHPLPSPSPAPQPRAPSWGCHQAGAASSAMFAGRKTSNKKEEDEGVKHSPSGSESHATGAVSSRTRREHPRAAFWGAEHPQQCQGHPVRVQGFLPRAGASGDALPQGRMGLFMGQFLSAHRDVALSLSPAAIGGQCKHRRTGWKCRGTGTSSPGWGPAPSRPSGAALGSPGLHGGCRDEPSQAAGDGWGGMKAASPAGRIYPSLALFLPVSANIPAITARPGLGAAGPGMAGPGWRSPGLLSHHGQGQLMTYKTHFLPQNLPKSTPAQLPAIQTRSGAKTAPAGSRTPRRGTSAPDLEGNNAITSYHMRMTKGFPALGAAHGTGR